MSSLKYFNAVEDLVKEIKETQMDNIKKAAEVLQKL